MTTPEARRRNGMRASRKAETVRRPDLAAIRRMAAVLPGALAARGQRRARRGIDPADANS